MRIKIPTLIISCFCTAFVLGVNIKLDGQAETTGSSLSISFSTAHAYNKDRGVSRRTARRTAKRVNRRHDYYRSVPEDCIKVIINGSVYHDCSGTYYSGSHDDGGDTYIIVNP